MRDDTWTTEDQVKDTRMNKPHVVILGAGASKAALPNGNKNGKSIPLMNDEFIHTVGLESSLERYKINYKGKNFEAVCSDIFDDQKLTNARQEIEKIVREYFRSLELPDHPTLYDHLVLSLRKKDIIATFNWDPFLWQALCRNYANHSNPQAQSELYCPRTLFLHGSVAVGFDSQNKTLGWANAYSRNTGYLFEPTPILLPIKEKNYSSLGYIGLAWDSLKTNLENAYILTIFGYGAPTSDIDAINMIKESFTKKRKYGTIEIINIEDTNSLEEKWSPFFYDPHYQITDCFYKSGIANYPRRTCEAIASGSIDAKFADPNPIPEDEKRHFVKLHSWIKKLTEYENNS